MRYRTYRDRLDVDEIKALAGKTFDHARYFKRFKVAEVLPHYLAGFTEFAIIVEMVQGPYAWTEHDVGKRVVIPDSVFNDAWQCYEFEEVKTHV